MGTIRPIRIAVIADTHDRLPDKVVEAIKPAEEIWHLGDVTSDAIVGRLAVLGPRVRVVRGELR